MKNYWLMTRIGLALIAIFSLGIWVGRVTAPGRNSEPLEVRIEHDDPADDIALKKALRRAMTNYRADLDLTREQLVTLRPMFVATSRRMQVLPKNSKARLAVLKEFHEELREHLTDAQQKKLAKVMEKAERRERRE